MKNKPNCKIHYTIIEVANMVLLSPQHIIRLYNDRFICGVIVDDCQLRFPQNAVVKVMKRLRMSPARIKEVLKQKGFLPIDLEWRINKIPSKSKKGGHYVQ